MRATMVPVPACALWRAETFYACYTGPSMFRVPNAIPNYWKRILKPRIAREVMRTVADARLQH